VCATSAPARSSPGRPNPNAARTLTLRTALSVVGRTKQWMSPVKRGWPWRATGCPPPTRYPTAREFCRSRRQHAEREDEDAQRRRHQKQLKGGGPPGVHEDVLVRPGVARIARGYEQQERRLEREDPDPRRSAARPTQPRTPALGGVALRLARLRTPTEPAATLRRWERIRARRSARCALVSAHLAVDRPPPPLVCVSARGVRRGNQCTGADRCRIWASDPGVTAHFAANTD
jgi:hypothetical protein